MVILKKEYLNCDYIGGHPITCELISQKWRDFSQAELAAIFSAHPNNLSFFEQGSAVEEATETVKTKQTENVNTTAPSTRATGSTVTTTATKGAVSEG